MKYGGHETFPIREGWLHKGLGLLIKDPAKLASDDAADWLGVGRNMAKSIRHWLVATDLAMKESRRGTSKSVALEPTDLGDLVWKHDPYFLDPATWWALHINLVTNSKHGLIWGWFFNQFSGSRFERPVALEAAGRFVKQIERRPPSQRTIQRDVACLLQSYSQKIPEETLDPEDVRHCPFIELGLMSHYRSTGVYELHRGPKQIAPEVFSYSVAKATGRSNKGDHIDAELYELWSLPNGPAKCFALTHESLFELAMTCEAASAKAELQIVGMAGQRVLRVANLRPEDWLWRYYERIESSQESVAV